MMAQDPGPAELVEFTADERLLAEDAANLPEAVGRPEAIPSSPARRRLVGAGATLTGVSLLAGIALILLGAIDALSSGFGALAVVALVVGAILVATHWGWVHVAEATADAIEARRNSEVLGRQQQWLQTIKPYKRYEVRTSVEDDGSISIVRVRHRPIRTGDRRFSFVREIEDREVHSGEESAAVAERAEVLRRQAALDTERERGRFELAADAYETALLGRTDEQQRLAARRAAAAALSDQINANLREPPLVE